MNPLTVSEQVLEKLRDLRRRCDEQAFIAGTALFEYEQRKLQLYIDYVKNPRARNTRLGALQHAFDEAVKDFVRRMAAAKTDGDALGGGALAALGLDPARNDLRIDFKNGAVLELRNGEWHPVLAPVAEEVA